MLINNYIIMLATGFSTFNWNYKMGIYYHSFFKCFEYFDSIPYIDGKLNIAPDVTYKFVDWYEYAMRANMPINFSNGNASMRDEMNVREYLQSRYINVRWFTPFLERLLHDEDVTLEEVDAAHRAAFGGMPLRYYSRLSHADHSDPTAQSIDDWLAECLRAPSAIS